MVEVTLKLPAEARRKVLETLREELTGLEAKASQLERELRAYEERYKLSSQELAGLWDEAVERKKSLPFPEEVDLDLVEWMALYKLYASLLNDIEELRESVKRLCEA